MASRQVFFSLCVFAFTLLLVGSVLAQSPGPQSRQIPASGQGTFHAQPLGGDGAQAPEIDNFGLDPDQGDTDQASFLNRPVPSSPQVNGASAHSGKKAKTNPEITAAFDGLNFRQQRLANSGKQFSIEPPDQGLCVGNGFVLESTRSARGGRTHLGMLRADSHGRRGC